MRQAHKVWVGIAAGVFLIVMISDLGTTSSSTTASTRSSSYGSGFTTSASPTTSSAAPTSSAEASDSGTAVVASVQSPADFVTVDARSLHVPLLRGVVSSSSVDSCEQAADLALADQLLDGRTVTLTPPTTGDSASSVPTGATQVDVSINGTSYASTFTRSVYSNRAQSCPTPTTSDSPPTSTASSSGDDLPDVHVHHDHGLPDGALTGGYCAKKWWC